MGRVDTLPVIDVSALLDTGSPEAERLVAAQIERACRDTGFFYVTGHGVPAGVLDRLDAAARAFFALSDAGKAQISMAAGGRAWRGWFGASSPRRCPSCAGRCSTTWTP
jgi:isopenicillin N synthase-like dioxygenase